MLGINHYGNGKVTSPLKAIKVFHYINSMCLPCTRLAKSINTLLDSRTIQVCHWKEPCPFQPKMDHKECPGRKPYQCAMQARIARSKDLWKQFSVFKMDGPEKNVTLKPIFYSVISSGTLSSAVKVFRLVAIL